MLELARLLLSVAGLGLPLGMLMLIAGRVKFRNELDMVVRTMSALFISLICYWMVGYGLFAGQSVEGLFGLNTGFLSRQDLLDSRLDLRLVILFSVPALTVIGAMAERGALHMGNILVSIVAILIAPVAAHWSWEGPVGAQGWLVARGFNDMGGVVAIFLSSAFSALAIAVVLGPRRGRFPLQVGRPQGQGPALFAVGVCAILFALALLTASRVSTLQSIPVAIFIFLLGISFAALSSGLLMMMVRHRRSSLDLTTASIAGAVALCSIGMVADPVDAALTGILAGALSMGAKRMLAASELDDPGDLIAAFMSGGLIGGLMAPLVTMEFGRSLVDDFVIQLTGVTAIAAWAFGATFLVAQILMRTAGLRVSEIDEKRGLSLSHFEFLSEPDFMVSTLMRDLGRDLKDAGERNETLTRISNQFSQTVVRLHNETNRATQRIQSSSIEPKKGATMIARIRLAEDTLRVKAEDILMLMESLLVGERRSIGNEQFHQWAQDVLQLLLEPIRKDLEQLARHLPLQADLEELESIIIAASETLSRCAHRIEQLSDLSDAQVDGYFARNHVCDIAELLADRSARIETLADVHNRPVQIDCSAKTGFMVNGDANALARILTLTVEGALNRLHSDDIHPVRLELKEQASGHHVILDCLDTGVSLSNRQIRAIKEPATEGQRMEELGLGQILPLMLVAQLVSAIGGDFAISSEHGTGTLLRCRFRKVVSKAVNRASNAA